MAMAVACREPRFLELNEAIKNRELRKQKTETGDTNAPIVDHVQKINTEEDYDSEVAQKANTEEDNNSEEEWNNGFMLEEHAQIQKDNAEEAKKQKERKEKEKEKEREEGYDTDENWSNLIVYDPNIKRVRCFANESLKWYNRQMGAKYKLKRVLEATATWCAGFDYGITFVAEECGSDDEPDGPALEYLKWVPEGDEKVVYNSGDDKPSDKLFWGVVYWKLPASKIMVRSCVIRKKEAQEHNTEEAKKYECNCCFENDSLKSYNRKTKKKLIRTSRNLGRSLIGPENRYGWKDISFFQMMKELLLVALGICSYYIIWIVLSKIKEMLP